MMFFLQLLTAKGRNNCIAMLLFLRLWRKGFFKKPYFALVIPSAVEGSAAKRLDVYRSFDVLADNIDR